VKAPSTPGRRDLPSSAADVIVVGGGIVGTAAAAFLAGDGARAVLVEREGLASGASGANSGVVQHPFDPALDALYQETIALYRELSSLGAGFELPGDPAGMLLLSPDEAVARRQQTSIAALSPTLRTEVLGGAALRRLEPALAPDLWACRVEIGFPVQPAASTYAYATVAESSGAVIRQGRAATVAVEDDRAVGVEVDGGLLAAGAVLVAAGPWSSTLLDRSGRWTPIHPRWGAVVEADLAQPPRHVLEEAGIESVLGAAAEAAGPDPREAAFSLVPFAGASAVGSTFLHREPDPSDWVEPVLVHASRFVPAVADAPIRGVRACARPQSVDGRPLIGRVPGIAGLFVCAGHGPWGISTGPASARLVVDQILGRGPVIPAALDSERFVPTP
jgi:glycine/D-amino acid oxidase-like deaminating enzyme